ncbi:nitrogenase component 1 [Aminipila luticellarii]|uniref:Oxidoreductase n=1 Tax=Aminipila luticellarii TaxID=2507160 RepID=A0A410PU83_9FIRM|nr:nitrogenase component 1 [Aminipila luticellarii]QAT42485.1 oxidoreductase [Aminipila luticellarii]
MNDYLQNITPDSFSGIVFGLEGMSKAIVLINGPTGCKFYHSATSDNQSIKQLQFDPLNYPEQWYFGQPRVPCTYLDKRDYVYGSKDKIIEALDFFKKNIDFDILCIVNSPGASLIGDDLRGIAEDLCENIPCVFIQTPGYSKTVCEGFEYAMIQLLTQLTERGWINKNSELKTEQVKQIKAQDQIGPSEKTVKKTVNLIGVSILHKYFEGDVKELTRLLNMCGVEVHAVLACDLTMEQLRKIGEADLNLVIHAEYGVKTAEHLKQEFGTPYYLCEGMPVGFKATERFVQDICGIFQIERERRENFIQESERARARAYVYLSRLNSLTGLPKGVQFAVEGNWSECYSYVTFLVEYFGMAAESISILNAGCDSGQVEEKLRNFLKLHHMEEALERELPETNSELVFANANTIARLKLRGLAFSGIEISLPTMGYVDILPKTHMGIAGAMLLTEQVINGLMF